MGTKAYDYLFKLLLIGERQPFADTGPGAGGDDRTAGREREGGRRGGGGVGAEERMQVLMWG
jgi:hypothetical protein